jgi:hypothetical protein
MSSKGIPTHLITIMQKIGMENIMRVNAGNEISEDFRFITQGVRQHAHYLPFYLIFIWMRPSGVGYRN